MMKKKLCSVAFASLALVLSACGNTQSTGGNSGPGTDPDIPVTNPTIEDFKRAISKDYSNCTINNESKYKEDPDSYEITSYPSSMMFYKGYAIVYNELLAAQEDPNPYNYYHDYEGKNYLAFEKGGEDVWLSNGAGDVSLALNETEFYLPDFLKEVDATKVVEYGGNFYIIDETEVARLASTAFKGVWDNDIQSISIILSSDGYISKIYGWEEEDNDDEYFVCSIGYIGETTFTDSLLPTAPNANNVMEYWEYKDWEGPEKRIYPTSATVTAEITDSPIVMEIEDTVGVSKELTFPAHEGQYHFVEVSDVNWVSNNEEVAIVTDVKVDGGWKKVIKAVGEGEAEIFIICSSEQDREELNVEPVHGVQSNKIAVTVNGLPEIDRSKAVYDLEVLAKDNDTKELTLNNLIAGDHGNYTATSNGSVVTGYKYATNFDKTKTYLTLNPADQDKEVWGDAWVSFDFDDQQVSSFAFYYGSYYGNWNDTFIDEITLQTSNDGTSWSTVDLTDEILENFSVDYLKLCVVEFAPATMVKFEMTTTMIGAENKLTFKDMVFSADENCHNHGQVDTVPVTSVVVSGTETVRMGDSITLNATCKPTNATDKSVTWHSSNEAVATVSNTGVVTPVAVGTTKITAESMNGEGGTKVTSNEFEVTVKAALSIKAAFAGTYKEDFTSYNNRTAVVDATALTMALDYEGYEVTLTLTDEDNRTLTFENGDDRIVATFNSDGSGFYVSTGNTSKLNGNYLAGIIEFEKEVLATTISMKVGGKAATATPYEIYDGDSLIVTATAGPSTANSGKDVTWTYDNTLATYDSSTSTLTAKAGVSGVLTLTASLTSNPQVSASITVNITKKNLVTGIAITGATEGQTIKVGATVQLGATLTPTNAAPVSLSWKSSKSTVAKVDASTGLVTAMNAGNVTITVTDSKSGIEASINLVVEADESGDLKTPVKMRGTFSGYSMCDSVYVTITEDSITITTDYGVEATLELTAIDGDYYFFGDEQVKVYNGPSYPTLTILTEEWADDYYLFANEEIALE